MWMHGAAERDVCVDVYMWRWKDVCFLCMCNMYELKATGGYRGTLHWFGSKEVNLLQSVEHGCSN